MSRRKILLGIVVALGAVVLAGIAWLEWPTQAAGQLPKEAAKEEKRTLTVSGTGSVRVKPDSARLYFTIESYADQVRIARADNSGKVQKVLKALAELKINGLRSKSDNVSVQQLTDRQHQAQLPRVIGYHIVTTMTVLAENDDQVKLSADASRMLDAVLENGGTGVSQIQFFKKGADTERLRREALTKAVESAVANGRALLAGMSINNMEPWTVSAEPQHSSPFAYNPRNSMQNAQMVQQALVAPGGDDSSSTLLAGDLIFTCTVSLTARY